MKRTKNPLKSAPDNELYTYWQHIFRYDNSHIIDDETVPQGEAGPGWFDQ